MSENIEVNIKSVGHNLTKVIVESNACSQLFSWGKDSANEREIILTLSFDMTTVTITRPALMSYAFYSMD